MILNRGLFLFVFDAVRAFHSDLLPLRTRKPLKHVVRCFLNARVGFVKLANSFER
jgi:hypothetical protein